MNEERVLRDLVKRVLPVVRRELNKISRQKGKGLRLPGERFMGVSRQPLIGQAQVQREVEKILKSPECLRRLGLQKMKGSGILTSILKVLGPLVLKELAPIAGKFIKKIFTKRSKGKGVHLPGSVPAVGRGRGQVKKKRQKKK